MTLKELENKLLIFLKNIRTHLESITIQKKSKCRFIYVLEKDNSKLDRRVEITYSTESQSFFLVFAIWNDERKNWVTKLVYNRKLKYTNQLAKEIAIDLMFDSRFELKTTGVI